MSLFTRIYTTHDETISTEIFPPIQGRFEEAFKSLEWLRGRRPRATGRHFVPEDDSELARLKKSLFQPEEKAAQTKGVAGTYMAQLRRPEVWKPLLLVVVIFFLQQFSGMSVITYYAVNAIKDAGSSVDAVVLTYVILVSIVYTLQ